MQMCRFGTTIPRGDSNQNVFAGCLGILDKNVEIAALVEDPRIHELKFRIEPRASPVLINQPLIRKFGLRILVQGLHVGMRRRVVEVEVAFLYVFAVIAFWATQSKEPFFQKRIQAIPHSHSKADQLMPVAQSRNAILAPAIGARSRLIVCEVSPSIASRTVVFTNRAPRALTEVGSPALPVNFPIFIFD